MRKLPGRRGFLLGGVAALAMLAGTAEATIPLTMVDNGIGIPGGTTFLGSAQSQSNSVSLTGLAAKWGAPLQPADLALFYGIVNTSATSSGIQGIASGPAGWTALSGGGVTQFGTLPVFSTRAVWWKVLTAADIAADTVAFSPGTLATASASGVMVFRGATTPSLASSTNTNNATSITSTNPVLTGEKLAVLLITLRADLAEVITPPTVWANPVTGVKFAGDFYFADPTTYTNSISGTTGASCHASWTTASPASFLWLKWV